MRQINPNLLGCALIVSLGMTGCSTPTLPPPAAGGLRGVVAATQMLTLDPTVSLPTAKPPATKSLPTPTSTLTIKPTATPTLVPSLVAQHYIVQEADTLSGLALQFNLTTETLAAANGLNENDFLLVGQEIIIPPPGEFVPAGAVQPEEDAPLAQPSTPAPAEMPAETIVTQVEPTPATVVQAAPVPLLPPPPPPAPVPSGPPLPSMTYAANINPLTGLPVANPANLQRRPLLVRVGNDVSARQSQAGLNSADMVYEEVTEWWVTRFTAIFLSETPKLVAPIRSARLINVQLVPQYQGALAHSGGSDPVRWEISQAPIVNLDEFYNPSPYFYRSNEGWQTRLAIDTTAARSYMLSKQLEAPVKLGGFFFSQNIGTGTPAPNIYVPYPGSTSSTRWGYDPAAGKYLRWTIGYPIYDLNGGQLAAANVIIYFAEHQATDIVEDSNGATSIRIIVNGRGSAWFFRDGILNKGYWQTDGTRPPYFSYEDGSPYPLKPGNTWVEVVPTYFTIGVNSSNEASANP